MDNLLAYFKSNPQEAVAVVEGKAMPVGNLSPYELIELLKDLQTSAKDTVLKFWI